MCARYCLRSLALILVLCAATKRIYAAPLSKDQLVKLTHGGVDKKVVVSLVKKDCVDFEIGADEALSLSKTLPAEVLQAAIECREAMKATQAQPTAALVPSNAPAILTPAPPRPAYLRFSEPEDSGMKMSGTDSSCYAALDYEGKVKRLKPKWSLTGPYGLAESWREEFPGVTMHDVVTSYFKYKGSNATSRNLDAGQENRIEVSPGKHRVSISCDPWWKRNDVEAIYEKQH